MNETSKRADERGDNTRQAPSQQQHPFFCAHMNTYFTKRLSTTTTVEIGPVQDKFVNDNQQAQRWNEKTKMVCFCVLFAANFETGRLLDSCPVKPIK